MNLPIFSKNNYEAARQIVDIIDEVVGRLPSEEGDIDPTRNADAHVDRLAAAVNLYGGSRMAIGLRLLNVFNNQWHTFSSIARQNGARDDMEAMHLVMEHVGLDAQVNEQQLYQLKNFMFRVLPPLRVEGLVTPEEELEYVVSCLSETGSIKISTNMRNAILFVNKNRKTGITREDAEKIKDALDKKSEISKDLEEMAGSRKTQEIPKLECVMTSGPEETVFVVRAPRSMEQIVEKFMERYFDVKPY
jgi:hypothetical protein